IQGWSQDHVRAVQDCECLLVYRQGQGRDIGPHDNHLLVAFGEQVDKGVVHPLTQIFSYLIQQADTLSFFHDLEEHQMGGRSTRQLTMDGEMKWTKGTFGLFPHVEDEAAVESSRFVGSQWRAEPCLHLARNRSLGEYGEGNGRRPSGGVSRWR